MRRSSHEPNRHASALGPVGSRKENVPRLLLRPMTKTHLSYEDDDEAVLLTRYESISVFFPRVVLKILVGANFASRGLKAMLGWPVNSKGLHDSSMGQSQGFDDYFWKKIADAFTLCFAFLTDNTHCTDFPKLRFFFSLRKKVRLHCARCVIP